MTKKKALHLALSLAGSALFFLTVLPAQAGDEGRTLLETRCAACHGADKVTRTRKTGEQWEKNVSRMMGKGAKLSETEKEQLIAYLTATYGK